MYGRCGTFLLPIYCGEGVIENEPNNMRYRMWLDLVIYDYFLHYVCVTIAV